MDESLIDIVSFTPLGDISNHLTIYCVAVVACKIQISSIKKETSKRKMCGRKFFQCYPRIMRPALDFTQDEM